MTEIFVNAGELQSLATTLGARAQELEARIDGVPQAAAFLANNWEGEAASSALDRIVRDEKKLRQIAEHLTANKKALESALETYGEAEQKISALWGS